jgi:hypothetical protein
MPFPHFDKQLVDLISNEATLNVVATAPEEISRILTEALLRTQWVDEKLQQSLHNTLRATKLTPQHGKTALEEVYYFSSELAKRRARAQILTDYPKCGDLPYDSLAEFERDLSQRIVKMAEISVTFSPVFSSTTETGAVARKDQFDRVRDFLAPIDGRRHTPYRIIFECLMGAMLHFKYHCNNIEEMRELETQQTFLDVQKKPSLRITYTNHSAQLPTVWLTMHTQQYWEALSFSQAVKTINSGKY